MSKMGAAQFFKKTLKAQGLIDNKVVKEVAESASTLGKNVKGTFAPNGKVSGSAVTKALLTKDDKYGRRMGNLYTGKKLNTPVILGAAALPMMAMYGTPADALRGGNVESQKMKYYNSVSDIAGLMGTRQGLLPPEPGINPTMAADGTAGKASKAPTLGATGNMVFAMHNARHG